MMRNQQRSLVLLAQVEDKREDEAVEAEAAYKKRLIEERKKAIHMLRDRCGFEEVNEVVSKMENWNASNSEEIGSFEAKINESPPKPLERPVEGKQPDPLTWKGSEQFRAIRAYWGTGITPWLRSPRPPRRRSI